YTVALESGRYRNISRLRTNRTCVSPRQESCQRDMIPDKRQPDILPYLISTYGVTQTLRILLANLLQSSRSTFSYGSVLNFFAFNEGMLDTQISALGGWPTVSLRFVRLQRDQRLNIWYREKKPGFLRHYTTPQAFS